MTGDLIDAKKADSKEPLELMRGLVQLAPVYFVTGNHEWWSGEYGQLEQALDQLGVVVLRNESMNVTVHEREFTLYLPWADTPGLNRDACEIGRAHV